MTDQTRLKPCPFCGEEEGLRELGGSQQERFVRCDVCDAEGPDQNHGYGWNDRADLVGELAKALRELLDREGADAGLHEIARQRAKAVLSRIGEPIE